MQLDGVLVLHSGSIDLLHFHLFTKNTIFLSSEMIAYSLKAETRTRGEQNQQTSHFEFSRYSKLHVISVGESLNGISRSKI